MATLAKTIRRRFTSAVRRHGCVDWAQPTLLLSARHAALQQKAGFVAPLLAPRAPRRVHFCLVYHMVVAPVRDLRRGRWGSRPRCPGVGARSLPPPDARGRRDLRSP